MNARVVVFGYGNTSRGDDGIGPLLLARVAAAGWPEVTCIEDFQLQLEHALDINEHDLALFIDAGIGTPAPFSFYEVHPKPGLTHTSHALQPEAVLDVYRRICGAEPPPAFVLCVRGERFELADDGLSSAGAAHLEDAWHWLQRLMEHASAGRWRRAVEALLAETA